MRKLKTFEDFSTEGAEPKFIFTEELGQKILDMGYVISDNEKLHSKSLFYYKKPSKEDIFGGDRFYVEGGNIIHGSNINTRNFLAKNAKQV